MRAAENVMRNPGPSWGYGFLLWAVRWWPRWFFHPMLVLGSGVGLVLMPAQRACSRAYLAVVLGRRARLIEVWRHFFAFARFLMLKLRAGRGAPVHCTLEPENAGPFESLLASASPALFGTFHFGGSDLLGYMLSARGRRVSIVRHKVGNSGDTRLLGERFAGQVSFLWINNPASLIFDLKAAIEAGETLALQCDRPESSAKVEAFHFLGANRMFPFAIYHLAVLFDRPVVFCIAVPDLSKDGLRVFASPIFAPDSRAGRAANLANARTHFQAVLARLETLVRQHPYLWFNFLPLNPEVPATPPGS